MVASTRGFHSSAAAVEGVLEIVVGGALGIWVVCCAERWWVVELHVGQGWRGEREGDNGK